MAKDLFHQACKNALQKDGWLITHDPYLLVDSQQNIDYEIDLGAERVIAAEKNNQRIAIEIKSFVRASFVHEFHGVLGQYLVYQEGLLAIDPDRVLYLAIPEFAANRLSEFPFILHLIRRYGLHIVVFDEQNQTITQWKP